MRHGRSRGLPSSEVDGHSTAIYEEVPPALEESVRDAASTCPEQAIIVSD